MTPKRNVFITDEMWRKINHKQLIELAQEPETAKIIVDFLDKNESIRSDLLGIYVKALGTVEKANR